MADTRNLFPYFTAGDLKQQIKENACFAYPELTSELAQQLNKSGHPYSKPEDVYAVVLCCQHSATGPHYCAKLVTNSWNKRNRVRTEYGQDYHEAMQTLLQSLAEHAEGKVKDAGGYHKSALK